MLTLVCADTSTRLLPLLSNKLVCVSRRETRKYSITVNSTRQCSRHTTSTTCDTQDRKTQRSLSFQLWRNAVIATIMSHKGLVIFRHFSVEMIHINNKSPDFLSSESENESVGTLTHHVSILAAIRRRKIIKQLAQCFIPQQQRPVTEQVLKPQGVTENTRCANQTTVFKGRPLNESSTNTSCRRGAQQAPPLSLNG